MTTIAVAPDDVANMSVALAEAVERGGGTLGPLADADALIWADAHGAERFPDVLAQAPNARWVQLPWAGIEWFVEHLDTERIWTCGKGVYAPPVAEHIMTLALAGLRHIGPYARSTSWPEKTGQNLLGGNVTILGAGGITEWLVRLLEPWDCTITVVRRQAVPFPGADRTLATADLHDAVAGADVVAIAWALTPETTGLIDRAAMEAMGPSTWIVNVGRGGHIVTADLIASLRDGTIAGAALDVTDPEPLPDDSPLWHLDNCIITPHVANTPEMGLPMIAARVEHNVRLFCAGEPLEGLVDVALGY